jgi:bifunctional DNA-binding transcriptional regulator/antitoxin component of YhaV-PrlF toxin-antitoxin module
MTTKIVKSTSRGQITLPIEWRSNFKTDNFLLEMHSGNLVIRPVNLQELQQEEVLFDADADNNGKGVTPDEMIQLLQAIQNG